MPFMILKIFIRLLFIFWEKLMALLKRNYLKNKSLFLIFSIFFMSHSSFVLAKGEQILSVCGRYEVLIMPCSVGSTEVCHEMCNNTGCAKSQFHEADPSYSICKGTIQCNPHRCCDTCEEAKQSGLYEGRCNYYICGDKRCDGDIPSRWECRERTCYKVSTTRKSTRERYWYET